MSTVADLIAKATAIQELAEDQSTKSDASHAAADNVTTVTSSQAALVQQAQAAATVAINDAQGEADSAKAATDEATDVLDTAIEDLIATAKSLEK